MKLHNRTIIVSGGSSGLGLATVEELLRLGAFVAILDRSPPSSDPSSSHTKFFTTDVTKTEQLEAAVNGTVEWTREINAPLGGVVNCAGVGIAAKVLDAYNEPHSLDLWNFVVAVNLTGTFDLTRLVLPHLVKAVPEDEDGEKGVIIMVSSSAAYEGQPGQSAYAATKGALRSMTLPMSRDLARHGVRVVSIAPGIFESSMSAAMPEKVRASLESGLMFPGRFGKPKEFAETVRWVFECGYVNGDTIRLSGAGRLPGKL